MEENWPLIIPPLLTIIDDDWTESKAKGCELMSILLQVTTSATLSRTGLGEVFEDAILPYLAYLPSLTPEKESRRLLGEVYPALVSLARTRYPKQSDLNARRKHLDKIVRQGILYGYYHAHEHVKITEFLVLQISALVDEMGVWSVKHLKVRKQRSGYATNCAPLTYRRISFPCSRRSLRRPSERRTLRCSWLPLMQSKRSFSMPGQG